MPSTSSPIAHGATGRCEKPKQPPTSATAPTTPGDADTRREELEQHQREPGDEQEVRDPRRVERVRELLGEIELAEADVLVRLDLAVRADADDRRRATCVRRRSRSCSTLPFSADDELDRASARSRRSPCAATAVLARQAMSRQTAPTLRPACRAATRVGVAHVARARADHRSRRERSGRCARPARPTTYAAGQREQRAGAARLAARRSDPHRDGHRRRR